MPSNILMVELLPAPLRPRKPVMRSARTLQIETIDCAEAAIVFSQFAGLDDALGIMTSSHWRLCG